MMAFNPYDMSKPDWIPPDDQVYELWGRVAGQVLYFGMTTPFVEKYDKPLC